MKYQRKTVVVDAVQWFKNGDHPDDNCFAPNDPKQGVTSAEGRVVGFYRGLGGGACPDCGRMMHDHGTLSEIIDKSVCPGDWIVTNETGLRWVMDHESFIKQYDPITYWPIDPDKIK